MPHRPQTGACRHSIGRAPPRSWAFKQSGCARRRYANPRQTSCLVHCSASGGVVKVCGVVCPRIAHLACTEGADLIGMILWPKAKRSVSIETAASISKIATDHGAKAVAVFVDESAEEIEGVCRATGVDIAQLHGDGAREAFLKLPDMIKVIYVVHAQGDGTIQTSLPRDGRKPEWYLVDSMKGGSGTKFDWNRVHPPDGAERGWLLAGGITDGNVVEAIETARPDGVDVSSGVCDSSGLRKDAEKVHHYVRRSKEALGLIA